MYRRLVAGPGGDHPGEGVVGKLLVAVIVVAYVLNRTPIGLAVRTVGENPAAVEAQGIDVTLLRIGAELGGVVPPSAVPSSSGAATRPTLATPPTRPARRSCSACSRSPR